MHPCELPDHVVAALLEREALLNKVRVHTVKIQQILDRDRLRSLQTKQLQVYAVRCSRQNRVAASTALRHTMLPGGTPGGNCMWVLQEPDSTCMIACNDAASEHKIARQAACCLGCLAG